MQPSAAPFTNPTDIQELPHTFDGSFAWLTQTPTHEAWVIDEQLADELPAQLAAVIASAQQHGLTLPQEFITFISTPALHKHLRSATGCYLDLAESVLPFANGYLIRFLNDQQDCAFWHLYTNATGSDHCVVASYERFDADGTGSEFAEPTEKDFYFYATSFESFFSRFWLENEIMFANMDDTPPPDVEPRFLQMYAR